MAQTFNRYKNMKVECAELTVAGTDVTSAIAEVAALNGVTASAAELNLIDGSTAGTVVASKALVVGSDKNLDVLAVADLKLGAAAGTSVTATAAELNILSGVTRTAAQLNEAAVTQSLTASTTVAADVLAIPVTHEVVRKTTGGDAEALTLADGSPGQFLSIILVTDGGGDGTLTPTTKQGYSAVVFSAAGQSVTLKFIDGTVGWVVWGSAGPAGTGPAITA
jgi:hypothetical protein